MFCPKCGKEIPDGSDFCSKCGNALTGSSQKSEPKISPSKLVLSLSLGALVFVALAYWAARSQLSQPHTNGSVPVGVTQPTPQPHSVFIVNTAITLNAASFSYYPFSVPGNANAVSVVGHFVATGGMGNDIIVYVLDEDGLANLKNGHPATTYYNSQKLTQASIHAVLPSVPGTYYLVFDNRFSLLTPKAVQVNAVLNYIQ